MTELQQIEFRMLKEFVKICEELNLTYYLVCGSALGAVKYRGFIPWDDDIDVALPRNEYEIFCKEAPSMLPRDIFLQNCYSDPEFPLISSKLRDLTTTYIEKGHQKIDMVHGVFIDVFPLDGIPKEADKQKDFFKQKIYYERRRCTKLSYSRFSRDNIRNVRTNMIFLLSCIISKYKCSSKLLREYDRFLASYSLEESEYCCNHHEEKVLQEYIPKHWYGEGEEATFENLTIRIPKEYDKYLTKRYGNWREDIPEEQKQGHHFFTICDLDRPYTYYKGEAK